MPLSNSYLVDFSDDIIIVADKTGFALVNLVSGALKNFKIGPVKHLELLIRRSSKFFVILEHEIEFKVQNNPESVQTCSVTHFCCSDLILE